MGYPFKENQVALVFDAALDESGDLTGEMEMLIAFPGDSAMSDASRMIMIDITTMLSAFLSYSQDKDELLDAVMQYRDDYLSANNRESFTIDTPTMGSA